MFLLICVLVLCNVNTLDSVLGAVLPTNDLFKLDIIHFNDFHDRFEETSITYPICKTDDNSCLGGFPRLYWEIMTLLKERPGALVLNAGDTYQGTYWYTLLKWNVTQKFMNLLPIDAHAIGNHEFDDGVVGLAPYLAALKAPVLAANMDTSKAPSLNGLFKSHVILERNGRRIGVIGLITQDTSATSNSENVMFQDPVETVKKEAQELTNQGVDIIIVLSHCGLDIDKVIAREVGDHIDVIVGGHTHSLLYNGTAPSQEKTSGPYPVIVESSGQPGHKVLVVTASSFTKYLGNITVYFDGKGELQSFDGIPVFLNRSIPEDPKIKELLRPYKEKLDSLMSEVVGYAESDYLGNSCGAGECAIGDLAADAFMNAAQEQHPSNLTKVAFLVRNMIRGSIPKGEVTRGSVVNALPLANKVMSGMVAGRHILAALEHGLLTHWTLKPFNGPLMPHISGMKLTLNTTAKKVVSALVLSSRGVYEKMDPDKDYQLITPAFHMKGGNGLSMLKENVKDLQLVGTDWDILEKYIRKTTPLRPSLDNRLTIENEF